MSHQNVTPHKPGDVKRNVVGVVGGVASGKSAVTQMLVELGGKVLNADAMAHEVLQQPEIINTLVNHFGDQILKEKSVQSDFPGPHNNNQTPPPELDRSAIGKLVFGTSEENLAHRRFLESVVQTRVRDRLQRELNFWKKGDHPETIDRSEGGHENSFLVLDIPLLFERDWDRYCDFILMVDTPDSMRRDNAAKRGWAESDWKARELNQLPVKEKRERATHVIVNDSSLDALRGKIVEWYERFLKNRKI